MQQLNVHDYYALGKSVDRIEREIAKIDAPVPANTLAWPLFVLRWDFQQMLNEPCALLPASQRAVKAVADSIGSAISDDIDEIFKLKDEVLQPFQLRQIGTAFTNFETILKNDMPEMSTFAVSQIGILRTDDLIRGAYRQIAKPLQPSLKDKAKADIIESGKCLAFRLSTASAFHACRAIETGIDQYYEALAGKPYEVSPNGGNNNWGAKTKSLEEAGADEKVTEFLTHIRKQYRNPVTHPDVVVDEHEAVDLFIASLSAISMMLGATKAIVDKNQPSLPGFAEMLGIGLLGGLHGTSSGSLDDVRPSDEKNSLGVETGVAAPTGSGEEGQDR